MPEMTAYETECRKRCEWCAKGLPWAGNDQHRRHAGSLTVEWPTCTAPTLAQFSEEQAVELLRLHTLRPESEWHERHGFVLWYHLPIQEPPYVGLGTGMGESNMDGTPTDCRRLIEEGWLTHWSPIPHGKTD